MPSRRTRIALGALAALTVAAGAAWKLGPSLLEGTVRDRLLAELGDRGIDASLGAVELTASSATLRDVCVMHLPPHAELQLACVDTIILAFSRDGVFSTDIEPTAIEVNGGFVNLDAEAGSLDEIIARYLAFADELDGPDRTPSEGSGQQRAPRGPRRLPAVHIADVNVQVAGQGLPLDAVRAIFVDVSDDDGPLRVDAVIDPDHEQLPTQLEARLPETWAVTVLVADDGLPAIDLVPSTALSVSLPAPLDDLSLSIGGAAFEPPYALVARDVAITDRRERVALTMASAALELRELTTSLPDLYFSGLDVDGLSVQLVLDDDLRPALLTRPERAETDEGDEPVTGDDTQATAESESEADPWQGREWWEKIPQRIHIQNASIAARRASGPTDTIALTGVEVAYALRVFHFQLDVTLDGTLRANEDELGHANVQLMWNWDRGRMRLSTDLEIADLPRIERFVRGTDGLLQSGSLTLSARMREAERGPGMWFTGSAALDDLSLLCPPNEDGSRLVEGPIELGHLSYAWNAERARDDADVLALRFSQGDGEIDGARFVVRPQFNDFYWDRDPWTTGGRLRVEIPVQPIETLWAAIPDALLGPLAEARMSGTWGLENEFAFQFQADPDDPQGRRRLTIEEPDVHVVYDEGLELVALPESLDVRRMLGAFSFVWLGPDATANRPMNVPAPTTPAQPGGAEVDGDTGSLDPDWARLDDISPYLPMVHLYREDGSFFRNHGFNWYQVRRVAEEMWWERGAGRGASTVSMQLVKNLFLTHERTLSRKVQEMFLTYWMSRLVDKERILEIYLNIIEWGPSVNGVTEAAAYYFGALPSELSLAESAWLSAIVPAPATRSQQRLQGQPPEYMQRRIDDIIDGLRGRDLISEQEQAKGHNQPVVFVTDPSWADAHPDRARRMFGGDETDLAPAAIGGP